MKRGKEIPPADKPATPKEAPLIVTIANGVRSRAARLDTFLPFERRVVRLTASKFGGPIRVPTLAADR